MASSRRTCHSGSAVPPAQPSKARRATSAGQYWIALAVKANDPSGESVEHACARIGAMSEVRTRVPMAARYLDTRRSAGVVPQLEATTC